MSKEMMSDVAVLTLRNMARTFRQKMVWTSDYARLQRMEDWRDEIEAFLDEDQEKVECDCEDYMLPCTTWCYRNDILVPEDYGFSLVLTVPGAADDKEFDHARAWYEIAGILFYADSGSEQGWYRHGYGPAYAREVMYSRYSDPMNWMETR